MAKTVSRRTTGGGTGDIALGAGANQRASEWGAGAAHEVKISSQFKTEEVDAAMLISGDEGAVVSKSQGVARCIEVNAEEFRA